MQNEIMLGESSSKLKLDPRTKLWLTFVISFILIGAGISWIEEILKVILVLIPATLFIVEGKVKKSFIYVGLVFTGLCLEYYILSEVTGALNIIVLIISATVNRFYPPIMMGMYTVSTTTVSEFTASMEKMRISNKIIIPMSVMFRFFPTIADESRAINNAMKMRGITKIDMIRSPLVYLEYKMVPLLMSIVKIGDELSAASLTKGLGSDKKRTNICDIGIHFIDLFLIIVSLSALVISTIY